MKVLQINCVYKEGSTGKITQSIHEHLLSEGEQSVVICGRRAPKENYIYPIVSEFRGKLNHLFANVTGVVYGGCLLSTKKIIKYIIKEKPDIVHLQCINGNFCNIFRLLEFLKKTAVPTVLTLHAEFMYTANCSHAGSCIQWKNGCHRCLENKTVLHSWFFDRTSYSWRRMHNIYKDWDNLYVVACSKWIANRASQSGEMANRNIRVINNGIDNSTIFYPRLEIRDFITNKYHLPADKKYVLYVSPGFSKLKGFDLFLELIKKCEDDPLHFLLVGDEYHSCVKNLTTIGKVNDKDLLAKIYSASDALVICSRNENYPTVCLEAISCGTSVVGFDVGGVSETIYKGMGGVVPLADIEALRNMLLETLENKIEDKVVENARAKYSKNVMLQEYMSLYKYIYEKNIINKY